MTNYEYWIEYVLTKVPKQGGFGKSTKLKEIVLAPTAVKAIEYLQKKKTQEHEEVDIFVDVEDIHKI